LVNFFTAPNIAANRSENKPSNFDAKHFQFVLTQKKRSIQA